jgi:xyloglucan-specific endo-beta-1,4-glucanase
MLLFHALALAGAASATPTRTVDKRASSTRLCGEPNASQLIANSPWILFSMNYNYQKIEGSSCVTYESVSGAGDLQKIKWGVEWDIAQDDNADLVKGYSFVGLTQNLETRLSDIQSIPADWHWIRSNGTAYKGTVRKFINALALVADRGPYRQCCF